MNGFEIQASGMVTGVGLDAASSCAAIRCGITAFEETAFMFGGDWLQASEVPMEGGVRGRGKLLLMVVSAIRECVAHLRPEDIKETPLLLCVAEAERVGRFAGLGESFLREVEQALGVHFHDESRVIGTGKIGGVQALSQGRELLGRGRRFCLVAGVDTYLVASTLAALDDNERLQTKENTHGVIPGEAAAAVLLAALPARGCVGLACAGIGFGTEPATVDSGKPLRADGLVEAIRAAFKDSGLGYEQVDFRLADLSGEPYSFKEAALAPLRTMRVLKQEFDIWHPADCIGDVGSAMVPLILGVALEAMRKGYAPGPGVLCHFSQHDSQRACLVLQYHEMERSRNDA